MVGRKCEPGCTCSRHKNGRYKREPCSPGCTCGKHSPKRTYGPRPIETREKISQALSGRKNKPHSAETRKKIGDAHRGRKHSDEFRAQCRERQLGKGSGSYMDNGYVFLTMCYDHPLASGEGIVAEHRAVLYDAIGPGPHECHWNSVARCGQVELHWQGEGNINVDHLDGDKQNNSVENLVPSCQHCNRVGRRLGRGWK